MSTITIDGTEYAEEALSTEAKAELVSMQYVINGLLHCRLTCVLLKQHVMLMPTR